MSAVKAHHQNFNVNADFNVGAARRWTAGTDSIDPINVWGLENRHKTDTGDGLSVDVAERGTSCGSAVAFVRKALLLDATRGVPTRASATVAARTIATICRMATSTLVLDEDS